MFVHSPPVCQTPTDTSTARLPPVSLSDHKYAFIDTRHWLIQAPASSTAAGQMRTLPEQGYTGWEPAEIAGWGILPEAQRRLQLRLGPDRLPGEEAAAEKPRWGARCLLSHLQALGKSPFNWKRAANFVSPVM